MNGWLIVLSVIGGVLLLLLSTVCAGIVEARIRYEGGLVVSIHFLGFRKTVFSSEKTAEKPLRDIAGCPNPERLLKKEEKRRRKAEKEAERKRKKQEKQGKKPAKKAGPEPTPNPKENLDMILAILKRAYALTKGKLRFDFRKLHLRIATGDAASTAILYGVVLQSAAYLLQWVQDHYNEIHRRKGDMTIEPDYLSEKSSIDLDLRLQVRGVRAIPIGLGLLHAYRTEKKRAKLRAKKRIQEASR